MYVRSWVTENVHSRSVSENESFLFRFKDKMYERTTRISRGQLLLFFIRPFNVTLINRLLIYHRVDNNPIDSYSFSINRIFFVFFSVSLFLSRYLYISHNYSVIALVRVSEYTLKICVLLIFWSYIDPS